MRERIRELTERYGQQVTLRTKEGETQVRAFLQLVTQRGDWTAMTKIGSIDERQWMYLGQSPLEAGDRVSWNQMEFVVESSHPWAVGETILYWWALLERAKEASV